MIRCALHPYLVTESHDRKPTNLVAIQKQVILFKSKEGVLPTAGLTAGIR